jgi:hypothetical protein
MDLPAKLASLNSKLVDGRVVSAEEKLQHLELLSEVLQMMVTRRKSRKDGNPPERETAVTINTSPSH